MFHAPLVLADYAGTLQFTDTSEVRARTTVTTGAGGASTPAGVDVATQPTMRARVVDSQWEYTLGYMPWLIVPDIEKGVFDCATCSLQFQNLVRGGVSWHDRLVRLTVTEDAAYGYFSSGNLLQPPATAETTPGQPPPPPTALQAAAAPTVITTGSLRTAARAFVQLDRRALVSLGVSHWVSGGLDASSREVLPFQYGARGEGSVSYALSKRDQAVTLASAQATYFSPRTPTAGGAPCIVGETPGSVCAPQDQLADLREVVRHKLDRTTTLSVSAGATVARSRQSPSDPFRVVPYPNCDVSVSRRFDALGHRGDATFLLDAGLFPVVDQLTGLVTNRAQGQASLTDRLSEVVIAKAALSGAQTLPTTEPFALTMVGGNVEVGFRASRLVSVALGERTWWQYQAQAGSFLTTFTYLSVNVAAPPVPF